MSDIDWDLQKGDWLLDMLNEPDENPTTDRLRRVLKDHYLAEVVCDHEGKRDMPRCQCSRIAFGWYPSVGEAVDAWIDHIVRIFEAPDEPQS